MKDNIKNFSVASAESEMRILNNLIEMNKEYIFLKDLDTVTKAKKEIKDRIRPGVYGKNKEKLESIKEELFKVIAEYLHENKYHSRCPFEVYAPILRTHGFTTNKVFEMMVKNDGALQRWREKIGEWEGFNEDQALKKIKYLKDRISEYKEYKKKKESNTDSYINAFGGGLGI